MLQSPFRCAIDPHMIVENAETGVAIRFGQEISGKSQASERFGRRATVKSVSPLQHVLGNY
jgi:hypothetical protein